MTCRTRNNPPHPAPLTTVLRILFRLGIISLPLVALIFWLLGPVQHHIARGSLTGIAYMLLGIAVFALAEGVLFKFWLLPILAQFVSERLYAGSYLPENDPLAQLISEITRHHRPDLLPELEKLVQADPRRVRGWLELARLQETLLNNPAEASSTLLKGADAVHNQEDAALLMWRAITLNERHTSRAHLAPPLISELTRRYPNTNYGRLAAKRRP